MTISNRNCSKTGDWFQTKIRGYGMNPVNTATAKATAITVIITREVPSISHFLVDGDIVSFKL